MVPTDARLVAMQDRDELRISQRDHVKLFARVPQKRYEDDGTSVV
jgi:Flp pilus assembly CpaF family ATPase